MRRSVPPLGLRCEVPPAAMRTRVRAPFAPSPPPPQVAVEPDAPQRPPGAGGRAVPDLLLAALHLSCALSAERGADERQQMLAVLCGSERAPARVARPSRASMPKHTPAATSAQADGRRSDGA